jgi:uncharacterized protein (DUF2236 family)
MAANDGYFPRGSVLRRVHEQRAVGLMYGQRALGIGALSPVNFLGTLIHTRNPERPFHRLARTGKSFETVFFGSRDEADRVLASVHRQHEAVKGTLPEDAGSFPAGTPYSAFDPELMLWTVAVIADSAQVFYEMLVAPLEPAEREDLWQDYIRFGELFGMPRDVAPPTYQEFRRYWEDRLAGDDAHLTDKARYLGAAIMFEIPVPVSRLPAMKVHNLIMLGSLPPRVREMYGLPWSSAHSVAFRATVAAVRAPRVITPRRIRVGGNTPQFELVARTESNRLMRGRPTPGVAA